jgi:hypothetical protein
VAVPVGEAPDPAAFAEAAVRGGPDGKAAIVRTIDGRRVPRAESGAWVAPRPQPAGDCRTPAEPAVVLETAGVPGRDTVGRTAAVGAAGVAGVEGARGDR